MNEKQQQLTFEKGITTIPSDAVCSDNCLSFATNLIYYNGEHHVIQTPAVHSSPKKRLLFVHKLPNGQENYIYQDGTNLVYDISVIDTIQGMLTTNSVSAVGKTLIVNMSDGLHYYLWSGTSYKNIGKIPQLEIKAYLMEDGESLSRTSASQSEIVIADMSQEDKNNCFVGLYAKTLRQVAEKKGFAKPFFVRAALEMYDGTYTMITNPILLFPTLNGSSIGQFRAKTISTATAGITTLGTLTLWTYYYLVAVQQNQSYDAFSDIVKDVVIFASEGINVYDTSTDQPYKTSTAASAGSSICLTNTNLRVELKSEAIPFSTYPNYKVTCLKQRKQTDIASDIVTVSNFYKICSIGTKGTNGMLNLKEKIGEHVLENLTTQTRLDHDDYYSRCDMTCDMMYVYNNRLNIAGITRGFFNGFRNFLTLENGNHYTYNIYVRIKASDGAARVVHRLFESDDISFPWFYYPDSRAERVTIWRTLNNVSTLALNVDLTEHPGLNGAYFYDKSFAGTLQNYDDGGPRLTDNDVNTTPEDLGGLLMQSEVNNPMTFLASGNHQVGLGKILGMAALTQALSQGQFGQYPLMVFTTEGIFAMSTDGTGLYTSIRPMSREVALASNPCITQTDGAIFFVSKKGLMLIVGNEVRCVSEQLNGRIGLYSYQDIFNECIIAYDYRDSLLWIFSETIIPQYALVYSIKSGTFAFYELTSDEVINVVNKYPDYLIQVADDNLTVFSLLERPNMTDDRTPYKARLVTRPLKLENAAALKSILQIRHIYDFATTPATSVGIGPSLTIEASNNLHSWVTIGSLAGTPWKYYRFTYNFNNLSATSTFAGSLLITQERRTNKLR